MKGFYRAYMRILGICKGNGKENANHNSGLRV